MGTWSRSRCVSISRRWVACAATSDSSSDKKGPPGLRPEGPYRPDGSSRRLLFMESVRDRVEVHSLHALDAILGPLVDRQMGAVRVAVDPKIRRLGAILPEDRNPGHGRPLAAGGT